MPGALPCPEEVTPMIEPLLHWLDTLNPVAVHLVNFLLLVPVVRKVSGGLDPE